jgi:maltose alpha-D-glucosyltransferase/alpha-amylase
MRPVGNGQIESAPLPGQAPSELEGLGELPVSLRRSNSSDTSVVYGESFILKVFRHVEEGVNPDLEIGRYLSEQAGYKGAAPVVGSIEYRRQGSQPITLGVLHRYVANQGNAWQYTLDQLSQYFERVAALAREQSAPATLSLSLSHPAPADGEPERLQELIGGFLETVRVFGVRTAELHRTLAANRSDPGFAPVPFDKLYLRSLYQSMRNLTGRLCNRLARQRLDLPESARPLADRIVHEREAILLRFRSILELSSTGERIRCHGDYHLGRLLHTGKDFLIIDFEGDTSRTIGERRVKRSPLVDVAGMIRSFDYAAESVLLGLTDGHGRPPGIIRPEDRPALEPWAAFWYHSVARQFVSTYAEAIGPDGLLPQTEHARDNLLGLHLFEKVFLEIDAELSERPDWAVIPLLGAIRMIGHDPADLLRAL